MQTRRVVVTGLGVVSSVGSGIDKFWPSIVKGTSGAGLIPRMSEERVRFGCEVDDFEVTDYMTKKDAKRNARFIQFGVGAGQMAFKQSGYNLEDPDRVGVYVGTSGAYDTLEEEYKTYFKHGPRGIGPFVVTSVINNMVAANISIDLGLRGPSVAPAAACAAGLYAISDAWNAIRFGIIDAAIAGGSDSTICGFAFSGYENNRTHSTRHDDPEHASRPFDKTREGFVMGEGAGVLFMETLESAQQRGATILAEILACHTSCDAMHITAPDQTGNTIAKTMQRTLDLAGVHPDEVSFVNAHGTSTYLNDLTESKAIRKVFNKEGRNVPVTAIKSMIGHTLSASGGLAMVSSVLAAANDLIPPTINTTEVDENCQPIDLVVNDARKTEVNYVLTNAFGFGGHNGCVLIGKAPK